MRIRERLIIPGLTLALLLALAGCGGGNGGDPSTPASLFQPTPQGGDEPQSAPTATPKPAASAESDREVLTAWFTSIGVPGWDSNAPLSEWPGVRTDDDGRVVGLRLRDKQLRGVVPPELGNLSKLEHLSLLSNELSGGIPPELGNLFSLLSLNLSDNQLSGEIPPELGNLSNLEALSLGLNQLSGEIPPELGGLSKLESLALGGNQLSGEIPPELGNLSNLERLDLAVNQLSGEIPPELGNLSNLVDLFLVGLFGDDNEFSGCVPAALEAQQEAYRLGDLAFC